MQNIMSTNISNMTSQLVSAVQQQKIMKYTATRVFHESRTSLPIRK